MTTVKGIASQVGGNVYLPFSSSAWSCPPAAPPTSCSPTSPSTSGRGLSCLAPHTTRFFKS